MANVNSVQQTQLVAQVGGKSDLSIMWGTYEIATALSAADTITMFTVPAGTTIHGGEIMGDDLDSDATETIELDVGDASSSTRFLNSGVLNGDAITNWKTQLGIWMPLYGTLKDGPYTYTADTDVLVDIKAAAATGGTGTLTLRMFVTYNDPRVSPPTRPI